MELFILLILFILHRVVFTIFFNKLQGKICEWEVFPRSQKHIFSWNIILIPQMLLVLAKEIYEWCLVADNPVSKENYTYTIYGFRKYISGKVGLGGGPPGGKDIWKYQNTAPPPPPPPRAVNPPPPRAVNPPPPPPRVQWTLPPPCSEPSPRAD